MDAPIEIGMKVRMVAVPEAVNRDRDRHPETWALFQEAAHGEFEVRGVNERGWAELWVNAAGQDTDQPCADSIWVEPECLIACRGIGK